MKPPANRVIAFALAMATFVVLWVVMLAVLAHDACGNLGGSLTGHGFACRVEGSRNIGWLALLPIRTVVLSIGAASIVPFVACRRHFRGTRRGA
jgi:hypothetical protein